MHFRGIAVLSFLLLMSMPLAPANAQELPVADLSITKSGPAQATVDTDITYVVTVTNLGPDTAPSLTMNDILPAGLTFVSLAAPGTFVCTTPAVGSEGTISCSTESFAAGATATFTIVAHITTDVPAGAVFTNVATVQSLSDPDDENNTAIANTALPAAPQADLAVTKTGPGSAPPGGDVTYTIVLQNIGPDNAVNATLSDTLPGTMTFVSLVQTGGAPLNCTTPAVGAGGTILCTSASFPVGTATFTLVGNIPAGTETGTSFTNTALANADNGVNEENDVSTTSLTTSAVNLSVTKSGPPTVTAGQNISYTISLANAGPDTAVNVSLYDAYPAGTTFVSFTQNNGPTASCSGTGGFVCGFDGLAPGASAEFTLVLRVEGPTSVTNTAVVTSESFDTDTANNSSSTTAAVTPVADLSVTKTAPASAPAATNVAFDVTVQNAGPSAAASVSVTDPLPPGTTFVSAVQTSGAPFTCANASGTITCTAATFAANATATFTFTVAVDPNSTGTLTNVATITSVTSDPDPANNTSSTTTTLTPAAVDLSISKTAQAQAVINAPVTYTIVVSNAGPGNAHNVNVTDVLPAGTSFVSATPTQGTCAGAATVVCALGTLNAGATATISLVVQMPSTPATISNTASVTSDETDTASANNSSTVAVAVANPAAIPTLSPVMLAMAAMMLALAGIAIAGRGN